MKLTESLKSGLDYFVHNVVDDGPETMYDVFELHYKQWWKLTKQIKLSRVRTVDTTTQVNSYHASKETNEFYLELREFLGWGDITEYAPTSIPQPPKRPSGKRGNLHIVK